MVNILKLAAIALLALLALGVSLSEMAWADPADNTFSGSTTAPGGTDRQFEIKAQKPQTPGTFHPTSVKVNGVPVEFTVLDDNTSSPEILLDSAPAQGAAVDVSGTTSGSGGPYGCTITW